MTEISSSSTNYEIHKSTSGQDGSTVSEEKNTLTEIQSSAFDAQETKNIEDAQTVFNAKATVAQDAPRKASEVTIPIGNSNKTEDEKKVSDLVDEKSARTIGKKNKRLLDLKITRDEYAKAKSFLENTAKEIGIDPDDIPVNEKNLYISLSIAYQRGQISKEEFIQAVEEFGSESVADAVRDNIPAGTQEVDEARMEKIRRQIKHVGKMRAVNRMRIAHGIFGKDKAETQELREKYLKKTAGDAEKYHRKIMETIDESIPAGCSKEVRGAAIGQASECIKAEFDSLRQLVKNRGYSEQFQSELEQICEQIYLRIIEDKERYLERCGRFFAETVEIQKAELEERKEVADKKLEEAQIAQKDAQEAKEKANLIKDAAKKMLRWFGVDEDADMKDKIKFVHDQSPRLFIDGKYALRKQKEAEDIEYDANSAKRLAEAEVEWAEKSLAFSIAQRDVFFMSHS